MSIPAEERDERVPPHVYRYVERELYDYPANKVLIQEYDRNRADILEGKPEFDANIHIHSNVPGDSTYAKVARLLRLSRKVDRVRPNVEAITAMLEHLTYEQRRLVDLKYFQKRLTNEGLAEELGWSLRSYYRRKDEVIRLFARAMGLW